MPIVPTIHTPAFAAKILSGKETKLIMASGRGNIKMRKRSGNQIILNIFVPNRYKDRPMTRKKIEKPEMEKT